jgi:phage gp36-like protein
MYATASDLAARMQARLIAELSGSEDGEPVAVRVEQALADAAAEIDSYLGARFALPIAEPPPVLTRIACDIAIYRLFETARDDDVKDSRKRYEDAIRWLKAAADGEVALDAPEKTEGNGNESAGGGSAARFVPPTFAGRWGSF